jgi:site-specific recombinase XerD
VAEIQPDQHREYLMRHLGLPHFAFVRGHVNGLPLADLWERYLYIDGDPQDERLSKRALKEIRESLAQIALRSGKPGTARLLRLQLAIKPEQADAGRVPSLAEFAEERGIEDDREEDQIAAWKAVFGDAQDGAERLIRKQLRAIDDLEAMAARAPELGDPVESWFAPRIAARLKENGVMTLYGLAARMARGPSWHASLNGIGQTKADRLVRWMRENALSVPSQMQIVPMEKMRMHVLSTDGANRGDGATLGASNDLDAVRLWVDNYAGNTYTAYRREAERLLLWSASVKGKPLSALTFEDMLDYSRFLADPQPADVWCAPRHTARDSAAWRPFEGPLSPASIRRAQTVLSGLFGFLSKQGHLRANPLAGLRRPAAPSLRQQFGRRLLTVAQFRALRDAVDSDASLKQARLGLILDALYACGLRLSELAAAKFEHLIPLDDGWLLGVVGKGGRYREVPIPPTLVSKAAELARARGCPCEEASPHNAPGHLIGLVSSKVFDTAADPLAGAGVGVISHDLKEHARKVADSLMATSPADAQRIARISAHWLRHTHASHALEAGVDLAGVQANLGHASLATTSVYTSAEQRRRSGQMQKFWNG